MIIIIFRILYIGYYVVIVVLFDDIFIRGKLFFLFKKKISFNYLFYFDF